MVTFDKQLQGEAAETLLIRAAGAKFKLAPEDVRDLSRQQLSDACSALEQLVQKAMETFATVLDTLAEDDEAQLQDAQETYLTSLKALAVLCHEVLLHSPVGALPEALHRAATLLHDHALLSLGNVPEVQDCVARLCSSWWERKAEGKEQLVAQTLPYILLRALTPGAKAADIKLCYVMRDAFTLLDFDDPSITDLKGLLLRAAMSPTFLQRPEGRKYVASLFNLHAGFVKELTAIVRNQIPSGRKNVLEAYGEVVFRAWKEASGACVYEVETELIQGLMNAAISASTPALAAALRSVLDGLHGNKHLDVKLAGALHRLYSPILFRAFAVANPAVRRNALQLLLAAFPIVDPEAAAEDTDAVLTQQLALLKDCLSDPCPAVRVHAVDGVARALNLYWEIIPSATSAMFITKLTGDLALDMSVPGVRVAVLEGLRLLLDNPHAAPVLKKALPGVAPLLADPSARVRQALASLLQAVSSSRSLHFYDVVPLGQLLEAMAHDVPAVARRIQSILLPSYFPNPEEGAARVAALLRANPPAGQAFCGYLVTSYAPAGAAGQEQGFGFSASVPIENILHLARALKDHLLATGASLASAAAAVAEPSNKKSKTGARGKAPANKPQAAGSKRRKQPVAGAGAGAAAAGAGQEGGEDGEVAVEVEEEVESVETWSSTLKGLVKLCKGLRWAVESDAVSSGDVQAAFEADSLELLLQVVLQQAQTAEAMESVLEVASDLHFTPAAAAVRTELFTQLGRGSLTGLLPSDRALTPAQRAGHDASLLRSALGAMACGPNAPKLRALLQTALGVRAPGTIHKPAAKHPAGPSGTGGGGGVEDACCHSCGHSPPEDTMLLCDGCEAAYHTACLRPALPAVPQGDWFCCACEQQLQGASLSREGAIACLSVLLGVPQGRSLVCGDPAHSDAIMQALQALMQGEVEELVCDGTASSGSSRRGGAAGGGAASGGAAMTSAAGLYCRMALHCALHSLLLQPARHTPEGDDDEEEEAEGDERLSEGEVQARRQAACGTLLTVVSDCLAMMQRLAQGGQAHAAPRLAHLSAMLGSLCDVQRFGILSLDPAYVAEACSACEGAVKLGVCAMASTSAAQAAATNELATTALSYVVRLLGHLSSVGAHTAAGAAGGVEDVGAAADDAAEGGLSQQLEQRLNSAMHGGKGAAASGQQHQAVPAPATSIAGLLAVLVQQLVGSKAQSAVAGALKSLQPALEPVLAACAQPCLTTTSPSSSPNPLPQSSWMGGLLAALGSAVSGQDELLEALCASGAAPPAPALGPFGRPRADTEQEGEGADVVQQLQESQPVLASLCCTLLRALRRKEVAGSAAGALGVCAAAAHTAGSSDLLLGALCMRGMLGGSASVASGASAGAAAGGKQRKAGGRNAGRGGAAAAAGAGGDANALSKLMKSLELANNARDGDNDADMSGDQQVPAGALNPSVHAAAMRLVRQALTA